MDTTQKIKLFVKEFTARIKGDDDKALSLKVLKQADIGLSAQITSLQGDTIDKEDAVDVATEKLTIATVNDCKLITDRKKYVADLINAKNELTKANKALADHKETIAFIKERLEFVNQEVDES